MAWTAPTTWVANQTLTAALLNTHLRDNFLELDAAKITGYGSYVVSTGANALSQRTYDTQTLATSQTLTTNVYTDLATVGPTVTLTTGIGAIVLFGCGLGNSTLNATVRASYAVSGATTSAADDDREVLLEGISGSNNLRLSTVDFRDDLTAGSNTFTMKYRTSAATATYYDRFIAVIGL